MCIMSTYVGRSANLRSSTLSGVLGSKNLHELATGIAAARLVRRLSCTQPIEAGHTSPYENDADVVVRPVS